MADYRKNRTNKTCSPSKEQKWNIPAESSSPLTSGTHQTSDTKATKSDLSSKSSAFESLFDSGYNSTTVSKTSIDLENEFNAKLTISDSNDENIVSSQSLPSKWSDSGVCITDSGLSIDNNYINNYEECNDERLAKQNIDLMSEKSKCSLALSLRDAFQPDQDGDTLLHLAIIQGLPEVAFALIRLVPHPDFLDIFNHLSQTPLHLATLTRQEVIVRRLIISGATIDLRDRHGNTALHVACGQSDLDSVRAIISPIDVKEIRVAQIVNYPVGVQHLPLDLLQLRNYEGETCIHLAAFNCNKKIISYLVQSGGDINAQDGKSGKSVLHWSVEMQKLDLVQFLVNRCKANVNVRSYAGHTPLHYAWMAFAVNNNSTKLKAIIKFLCDCGGEPSLPPNDSDSDMDSFSDEE